MSLEMIFILLGGLALFLYGMQMMSTNLEAFAGDKLKRILERLTSNRILGVLVGAVITAVIQSSSATTVMVVGFVNSGMMTLKQAVWIIMGANIGTTITGQLVALDIGKMAPLIAFVGIFFLIFTKNKKAHYIGSIIAGLGVLFIGLGMMSDAMAPLRENEAFVNLLTSFKNPLLGILAGALFTAVIQSSSASVGILQALAVSGVIGLDSAVFVLFGQNIGTCITAVIASIGANRNAKRTTLIHLMFNMIGTVLFVLICTFTPFTQWVMALVPNAPAAQIANVHTIFNIVTTVLLVPFGTLLARLATKILPDKKEQATNEELWLDEIINSNHLLGVTAIAVNSLMEEVRKMYALAKVNVLDGFDAIKNVDLDLLDQIKQREEQIDLYNMRISKRISKVLSLELSLEETNKLNQIFKIVGNVERVGDHAMNLAEYASMIKEKGLVFSEETASEIQQMKEICGCALEKLDLENEKNCLEVLEAEKGLEQQIDDTTSQFRARQIERIHSRHCEMESAIIYSELLTDYERIGDHLLNIAEAYCE